MTDRLSPQETQCVQPGQVVVNIGADVWKTWANASGLSGAIVGMALTQALPGHHFQVLTIGRFPFFSFNIGPGNAGTVIAGRVPTRGTSGLIIGTCDSSGEIFLLPTQIGQGSTDISIPGIPNVTILRATTPSIENAAVLLGYNTANDGGGGTFVWSTKTAVDDGGTIFNAGGLGSNSIGWRRIVPGHIDIRFFGASTTNTGSANRTAITAADAAAVRAGGPGIVYFPGPGTYDIDGSVVPSLGATWEGSAQGGVTINCTAATHAINITSTSVVKRLNITSAGGGIRFDCHDNDIDAAGIEDILISALGATSIGVEFLCDNSHYCYFPTFKNVSVIIGGAGAPLATGVAQTGSSGQCIRLQWTGGGRIAGVGLGIETSNGDGWHVCPIAFDGIYNDGPTTNISGVNTSTGVFTTSSPHGKSPGDLVHIMNVGGVTGIQKICQILTTPTGSTFTLFATTLGGAYTSGGTVALANGLMIHCGAGSEANFFRGVTPEYPDTSRIVVFETTAYQNLIEMSNDVPAMTSQIIDLSSGRNSVMGCDGAGGYVNFVSPPMQIGGITMQAGVASTGAGNPLVVPGIVVGGAAANAGSVRLPNGGSVTQAIFGGGGARNLIGGLTGGFNRTLIGDPSDQLCTVQSPSFAATSPATYGARGVGIRTITTSSYVCDSGAPILDDRLLLNGVTSVTMPNPNRYGGGSNVERVIEFKDISGNADVSPIVFHAFGSETFDGQVTATINTKYGSFKLQSDGTNWWIL